MLVVGLTGSLGTGKSTVASMFARLGAVVIDADEIVHRMMRQGGDCYTPILKAFGADMAGREGIDRKKLAAIVFRNQKELGRLAGIVHPKAGREMTKQINHFRREASHPIIVLEVPLLFESGFDRYADVTIVVKTAQHRQIARAVQRMNITRAQALRRIRAQMPFKDKIRLTDFIIDNNHSKTNTLRQVKKLWQELLKEEKMVTEGEK